MKRPALYSSRDTSTQAQPPEAASSSGEARAPTHWVRGFFTRHRNTLLILAGVALAILCAAALLAPRNEQQEIGQEDIDAAVLHTLETRSLQSRAAKAAESVSQSVVRIRGFVDDTAESAKTATQSKSKRHPEPPPPDSGEPGSGRDATKDAIGAQPGEKLFGIGTGVVIVDRGVILTNLHVVSGVKRVVVTFYDGSESEADLISVHPENDLAVLHARSIPDDLPAATIGSSQSLRPGEEVVAVGFPFGIGPSVSAGVVSGLEREFRAPGGRVVLTHLIQFDAPVNPGNSGGPLVTMDGEVVGIVTALYNPNGLGTYVGMGFAVTIAVAGNLVGISPF